MNRILIVDDEKDNLQALMRLLRGQFEVVTTTSPFEAIKLVQKDTFSVIISDQKMPEMKGVDLLEKTKHVSPLTTRVLLTGFTEIESVIEAINRGHVYRYIAKPWDPEELKVTIRQADEAFQLRREVEEKNRKLEKALADLKALDKAKHRFLSLISHELNTPLTVTTSYLTLLTEKQAALGEDGKKAVGAIAKATQRLSDIVAEVLTYVRLDLDSDLSRTPVDLKELVERSLKEQAAAAQAKKQTLPLSAPPTPVECLVDRPKLEAVLGKLLTESIRRAPAHSEIRVSVFQEGEQVGVGVWRSGETIGMEAFEPLAPTGQVLHHQQDLGLGLALGKLVIEAHGGVVELSSDAKTGTSIRYRFPAEP